MTVDSAALGTALARIDDLGVRVVATTDPGIADEWPARIKGFVSGVAREAMLVEPCDTAGVAAVLEIARSAGARLQALGLASSVVGAIDTTVDVLVSLAKFDRISPVDVESGTVTVGAGVRGSDLEKYLNDRALTLGHYPQSLAISSVGGWVATRATGTCSAFYGGIERLVVGLEIVLPSGEIVTVAPRPRPSGGLDLIALLCGAEGSFGIITSVTLAVSALRAEQPICTALPSLAAGLAVQRTLVHAGLPLSLVRLYNHSESIAICPDGALLPGECLLVVTAQGHEKIVAAANEAISVLLDEAGSRPLAASAADRWFAHRYAGPGFMADRNAEDGVVFDTIEVALPWRTAAEAAAEIEAEVGALSEPLHLHFSHVYPTGACLYVILRIGADDEATARARWAEAWETTLDIVSRHEGTLAHHHGIGAMRARRYAATAEGRLHAVLAGALDPEGLLGAPLIAGVVP